MNWIKIAPGCEMPQDKERVLITLGGVEYTARYIESVGRGYFYDDENDVIDAQYWARVEIPDGCHPPVWVDHIDLDTLGHGRVWLSNGMELTRIGRVEVDANPQELAVVRLSFAEVEVSLKRKE